MNNAAINSILIPLEGASFSQRAIAYGIYIGKRMNIPLIGLYVAEGILVQTFREDCLRSGISPDLRKIPDLSASAISAATEDAEDMLLLIPRQEPDESRNTLNSLLESTILSVTGSRMAIPPEFLEIESMGLIYDGSPEADLALDLAVSLSQKAVWPMTILLLSEDHHRIATLNRQLDDYFELHADDFPIDWDTVALEGSPYEAALRFIRDGSIELLVMASPGQQQSLVRILRESPIPLIEIR